MRPAGVSSGRLWPAAAGGSALVEPGLVRDLRRDRAPAGSPVTGLLMGCRARFGVSTRSLGCRCRRVLCPVSGELRSCCKVLLFIGDDWAEDHHDLELEDETGRRLAKARLPEGLEGITRFHALVAQHAPADWADLPSEEVAGRVVVGIETDHHPARDLLAGQV